MTVVASSLWRFILVVLAKPVLAGSLGEWVRFFVFMLYCLATRGLRLTGSVSPSRPSIGIGVALLSGSAHGVLQLALPLVPDLGDAGVDGLLNVAGLY